MRRIASLLFLILLFPTFVFAAQIFGSLKQNNTSVGQGVRVRIQCAGEKPYEADTDGYGSYKIYVPHPGKCGLSVFYGGRWSAVYDIYSDQTDPVRYDFALISQNDGSLRLERK